MPIYTSTYPIIHPSNNQTFNQQSTKTSTYPFIHPFIQLPTIFLNHASCHPFKHSPNHLPMQSCIHPTANHLTISPSNHRPIFLSIQPPICLSIQPSIQSCIHLFTHLSIHPSNFLSTHPTIRPPVHPSNRLSALPFPTQSSVLPATNHLNINPSNHPPTTY